MVLVLVCGTPVHRAFLVDIAAEHRLGAHGASASTGLKTTVKHHQRGELNGRSDVATVEEREAPRVVPFLCAFVLVECN